MNFLILDDGGDIGVGGLMVETKKEFLAKYKVLCGEYGFCIDDGISNNPQDLTIDNVVIINGKRT